MTPGPEEEPARRRAGGRRVVGVADVKTLRQEPPSMTRRSAENGVAEVGMGSVEGEVCVCVCGGAV